MALRPVKRNSHKSCEPAAGRVIDSARGLASHTSYVLPGLWEASPLGELVSVRAGETNSCPKFAPDIVNRIPAVHLPFGRRTRKNAPGVVFSPDSRRGKGITSARQRGGKGDYKVAALDALLHPFGKGVQGGDSRALGALALRAMPGRGSFSEPTPRLRLLGGQRSTQ